MIKAGGAVGLEGGVVNSCEDDVMVIIVGIFLFLEKDRILFLPAESVLAIRCGVCVCCGEDGGGGEVADRLGDLGLVLAAAVLRYSGKP